MWLNASAICRHYDSRLKSCLQLYIKQLTTLLYNYLFHIGIICAYGFKEQKEQGTGRGTISNATFVTGLSLIRESSFFNLL